MTLTALAKHLAETVAATPRQRIEVEDLYGAAVRFDRSLATAPSARGEIRRALDELAEAGLVVFPRSRRDFDARDEPHLPTWVRRPVRERTARAERPVRIWPPALEAASRIAGRPEEFAVLDVVTAFLREGGATRPIVPVRERSLELFEDEKKLDRLEHSRLFVSGALTLDLLRCRTVPIPFVSQWVPGSVDPRGIAVLIAENHHTYASLLAVTRTRAASGGPGRHVGYGTGGQFPSAVLSVPSLSPVPDRIVYFGDVDLKGLRIPMSAQAAGSRAGLPDVLPATRLYELLFDQGHPRPADVVAPATAAEAAAWLGPALAPRARDALRSGVRLPQEAVGYELLTKHGELLDQV